MSKELVKEMLCEYEAMKQKLNLFDINTWIGRPESSFSKVITKIEDLSQELKTHHIREAVVSHLSSLAYDINYGNNVIMEAVQSYEELYAGIILIPSHTGEIGNPEEYISDAIKRKARMVRLFPKSHTFSLREWSFKEVPDILSEIRVPVCIWHTETSWEDLYDLCSRYSNLPVILEGTGQKILYYNRYLYPLLYKCPNLYLEIHNLVNYLGLDEFVKKFGPERFLFGSRFPYEEPESVIMLLTHGNFSMEKAKQIAGDNFRSLLEKVKL